MKRTLLATLAMIALLAASCGSDKPSSQPTATPAATEAAATAAPRATSTSPATPTRTARTTATPAKSTSGTSSENTFGRVFGSVFGGALSSSAGATGSLTGLGAGDPTLEQYLPSNSQMPSGYTNSPAYSFRAPDGITSTGGMNISARIANSGDASSGDFSSLGVVAAMVIKPDDLQDLGNAFASFKDLSQQDLEDAIASSSGGGALPFKLTNVSKLDAPGLGDGAAGFQMTIDISALGELISGFAGGSGADVPKLNAITMRMYFFARGDYAGAVLRLAFTDTLPTGVDELALAKIIDEKLKSAH